MIAETVDEIKIIKIIIKSFILTVNFPNRLNCKTISIDSNKPFKLPQIIALSFETFMAIIPEISADTAKII